MNKTKIGVLVLTICFSINAFGQIENFDLSKYKLPDIDRKSLETNFKMYGSNDYYNTSISGISGIQTNNNYSGNINLNYNHYISNSKYQKESNFGLSAHSSFNKTIKDTIELTKLTTISPSFYYNLNNRKYFTEKLFFETDIELSYEYEYYKNQSTRYIDNTAQKDDLQTHTLSAYVPLKFGTGRIEQVQDARQAVYIFDELSKVGRTSTNKSDEEVIEFAKLISKIKYKRFFDSRLHKIEALESLDSFLISNNYVSKQDAKYFATLNDMWDYANTQVRYSGTRISGAIIPGYYLYDYNNTENGYYNISGEYNLSTVSIDGGIELKHEKPINLAFQNSINLNCYAGLIEGKQNYISDTINNSIKIPNIKLTFDQTIGFYPNTRTQISLGYSLQYFQLFKNKNSQNDILEIEGKGVKAALDLSMYYYISPRLRLSASSSLYYIWQNSQNNVIFNFNNLSGSYFIDKSFYSNSDFIKINRLNNYIRVTLSYSVF